MQDESQQTDLIAGQSIGKWVVDHRYLHVSAVLTLPSEQQAHIDTASELARLSAEKDFNVIKLHRNGDELSLLNYPAFFDEPFPVLARSWRISLARKTVVFRTYEESRNPPILHRKELLLPCTHPRISEFSAVTEAADSLGLFDEPSKIGFREQWFSLIAERGYELSGSGFLPLANATASEADASATP